MKQQIKCNANPFKFSTKSTIRLRHQPGGQSFKLPTWLICPIAVLSTQETAMYVKESRAVEGRSHQDPKLNFAIFQNMTSSA